VTVAQSSFDDSATHTGAVGQNQRQYCVLSSSPGGGTGEKLLAAIACLFVLADILVLL